MHQTKIRIAVLIKHTLLIALNTLVLNTSIARYPTPQSAVW